MASAEEKSEKVLENSIAMELLNKINKIEYTQVVPKLNYCDAVRKPDFEAHPSSKKFRLDTRDCYLHNNRDPHNLFAIFRKYSCDSPELVRHALIIHVNQNYAYYEQIAKVYLSLMDTNLHDWLEDMSEELTFGDELCLYALCRLYNRHCIVFTKTKAWSTILPCEPTSFNASLNLCDLYLLYMG